MTKILIVGDSHASRGALRTAVDEAANRGMEKVFVVGDFGFWPNDTFAGQDFLESVVQNGKNTGIITYFLPGNHEDWRAYLDLILDGEADEDGFVLYDEGGWLRAAPPVHNWSWDGVRFGSVGGAYSIDRSMRTLNRSWFKEEIPQLDYPEQLAECDVLLTHDAPINLAIVHGWENRVQPSEEAEAEQSHMVIYQCIEKAKPQIVVHGHWHLPCQYPSDFGTIIGLDQSSGGYWPKALAVLDTEARKIYNWNQFVYDPEGPGLWQLS